VSEKTEKPTPKKLRDARKKGQVSSSKDVIFSLLTLVTFAFIGFTWDYYYAKLSHLILLPTSFIGSNLDFPDQFKEVLSGIFTLILEMTVPVLAVVIITAIIANVGQFGLLVAFDSLKPELKKLNPVEGAKKIFSVKNLFELLKSSLKIVFLVVVLTQVVLDHIQDMIRIPYCGLPCIKALLGSMMMRLAISTAVAFIFIAGVDYVFQKFQHIKKLKMSKHEVKQEYKEMEGDPFIKSKRRQLHQELQNQNMINSVKRSTVVVTNPTHIAIALEYREGETPLPVVRAKGENLIAHRIVEVAREEGIPVMENVPLARALHEEGGVDDYIPSDLIEAVAEVLRWVARTERRDSLA